LTTPVDINHLFLYFVTPTAYDHVKERTMPNDIIGVPFAGTAPEIIAAEKLHRRTVLTELDEGYCDLIINRWQEYTGQNAERL